MIILKTELYSCITMVILKIMFDILTNGELVGILYG